MGSILGLDYGSSRTGVALAGPEGGLAVASTTLEATSYDDLLAQVVATVEEKGATLIVVGLPLGLDGGHTPQTLQTLRFVEDLRTRCAVPVETHDERLTSSEAKRRGARTGIDAAAATIMLQSYLDTRRAQS